MTVSVVVPVFEGRRYLAEAIESILRQTRRPDEVVVVDDGSSDGSIDVLVDFPAVRGVQQAHAGQAAALNRGVALTTGEYLAFLDADDRWLPDKVELQLAAFARNPALDLVFGAARQFLEPELAGGALPAERTILPARLPSAIMVRRASFERLGPFSSEYELGGVVEWSARAADLGLETECLDRVVYERRIHPGSTGVRLAAKRSAYASVVKAILDRRRQGRVRGAS